MDAPTGTQVPEPASPPARRHNPLVALILSFLAPGIGHLYVGRGRAGAMILVGYHAGLYALAAAGMLLVFWGLVVFNALRVIVTLAVIVDAVRTARTPTFFTDQPYTRPLVYVSVLIGVLLLQALTSLKATGRVEAYKMPSESMEPSLLVGDYFICKRISEVDDLARGDIVVFKYPGDGKTDYVKRAVAFPGERVEIAGGELIVAGQKITAPWAAYAENSPAPDMVHDVSFGPLVVPDRTVFVLGDNLANSVDSRVFGTVGGNLLRGKALYVYASWDPGESSVRFSRIGHGLRPRE